METNQEVQDFLTAHNIGFSYSPSGSSNSTGMVEVGNRILEDVIRQGGDWDDNLPTSTVEGLLRASKVP